MWICGRDWSKAVLSAESSHVYSGNGYGKLKHVRGIGGAGLGLDEKAVEAVQQSNFFPLPRMASQ